MKLIAWKTKTFSHINLSTKSWENKQTNCDSVKQFATNKQIKKLHQAGLILWNILWGRQCFIARIDIKKTFLIISKYYMLSIYIVFPLKNAKLIKQWHQATNIMSLLKRKVKFKRFHVTNDVLFLQYVTNILYVSYIRAHLLCFTVLCIYRFYHYNLC